MELTFPDLDLRCRDALVEPVGDELVSLGWLYAQLLVFHHHIMGPSHVCFAFNQGERIVVPISRGLLKKKLRLIRAMIRSGQITVPKDMCHSTTIFGKKYYLLVLKSDEIAPDPILTMVYKIAIGGSFAYFFRNKKKRDAVFNMLNDVAEENTIYMVTLVAEEKKDA